MENVEKVFHNDTNVTVTQSRFIANGRTYTMRNISSVSVSTVEKDKKFPIVLLVAGCLMALKGGGVQIAGFALALGALIWLFTMKITMRSASVRMPVKATVLPPQIKLM